jgi:hypothetical protein
VSIVHYQDHFCPHAFYVPFGDVGAPARDDQDFKGDQR